MAGEQDGGNERIVGAAIETKRFIAPFSLGALGMTAEPSLTLRRGAR
jgi:hypothetical protein